MTNTDSFFSILIWVAIVYFVLLLFCIYFGQLSHSQGEQIKKLSSEKLHDNEEFLKKVKNFEDIITKLKKQINTISNENNSLLHQKQEQETQIKQLFSEKSKDNEEYSRKIKNLENSTIELTSQIAMLNNENNYKQDKITLLQKTLHEAPLGFPSLLEVLKKYEEAQDKQTAYYLETKSRPAYTAAEVVREETNKRRQAEYECRQAKLFLDYFCSASPELQEDKELHSEQIEAIESPAQDENEDVTTRYLSREEYQQLSSTERNQLALDRFWKRHKSKLLIGRLYEQYVGYLYEKDGWLVEYYGISEGFSDKGRDLICHKDNTTLIIQCKNWSKLKTIYEKHLFQLFGTTFEYERENPFENVKSVFYTSTTLSEFARTFAQKFNIELHENFELQYFPIIKCNIGREGEKIYHLPFDQQYYNTKINPKDGDFYCSNVKEAEDKGFRRAFRWHGNNIERY